MSPWDTELQNLQKASGSAVLLVLIDPYSTESGLNIRVEISAEDTGQELSIILSMASTSEHYNPMEMEGGPGQATCSNSARAYKTELGSQPSSKTHDSFSVATHVVRLLPEAGEGRSAFTTLKFLNSP